MNILANFASPTQWFILVIVCLVVFGAKRLPDIARNVGKGLNEFKKARKEIEDELLGDDDAPKKTVVAAPAPAAASAPAPAPVAVEAAPAEKKDEASV